MRLIKSPIFKLIVLIFSIFAITQLSQSIYNLWLKKDIISGRLNALEEEYKRNLELKKKITETQNPLWVEAEIRNKLGLVLPGETLVLIETPPPAATDSLQNTNQPVLKQWWELFFK